MSIYLDLSKSTVKLSNDHFCHFIEGAHVRCIVKRERLGRAFQEVDKIVSRLWGSETMLSSTNNVVMESNFKGLFQCAYEANFIEML